MKRKILFILLYVSIGYLLKAQELGEVSKVIVNAEVFSTLTPIDVSCEAFLEYFPYCDKKELTDVAQVQKIIKNILTDLKIVELEDIPFSIDTRLKMYLYTNKDVITVCANVFYTCINGKYYYSSPNLACIIDNIFQRKSW